MITYRSNKSGTLHAAYLHLVRVGYVERRLNNKWRWQLIFLQPNGGAYYGGADDEDGAKDELARNLQHWIDCAGLGDPQL